MIRTIALALGLVSFSTTAFAASRTVCVELRFTDNRSTANCATTGETGNLRGCVGSGDIDQIGAILELWDKDADGTDEYIVQVNYTGVGGTCWAFEWDNNSGANAELEANPDVYVKYTNWVIDTGGSRAVLATDASGSFHPAVSFRNGEPGDPDRYVAVDATASWIFGAGYILVSNDVNTDLAKRAMALDSVQHSLQQFSTVMTSHVTLQIPDPSTTTGQTLSGSVIEMSGAQATDGIRLAHEMGHAIHIQVFNQTGLVDDCTSGGAGWTLTSTEFESCSTTEGFATYVGLASWYDGGVSSTQPNVWGFNFETATPNSGTCAANKGLALQVAKGFWDMDDVTNEASAAPGANSDGDAWYPSTIVAGYGTFAAGTGNRQKLEADQDGVNVRDYFANSNPSWFGASATQFNTMLNHNCLQNQDNN